MIDALAAAAADPGTHQYPSNRGRPELREAFARFYERRFGVTLDPETEIIPALGAKECVFNLNLAFLDPDSVALAADPGYPVYTGGPLLAGAEAVLMPLLPGARLRARPRRDRRRRGASARGCMYLNYPNNPTGAVVPDGLFERAVEFGREHDVLVVHDASYTETTFDGYVAPSFLETPGAKEVGVEVFSLSKGWNMTGWRTAAIVGNAEAVDAYWKLKTNIDSGMFEAVQLAAAAALDAGPPAGDARRSTSAAATWSATRSREIGVDVTPPKGTIYVWAPVPEGHTSASYCELVLEESGVVVSPGGSYGAERRGLLPHLADRARRAPGRGGRAAAREPGGLGVHYCGVVPMQRTLQLAMLEEVRDPEPPIRLSALFYEPGSAGQVAAELRTLGDVVVGVGAPLAGRQAASCDGAARGVPPQPPSPEAARLAELLGLPAFTPARRGRGPWTRAPTATSRVRDQRRRRLLRAPGPAAAGQAPPVRHAAADRGAAGDHVIDEGGDLWHRRIEELDALACALCAHRYAVGHALLARRSGRRAS